MSSSTAAAPAAKAPAKRPTAEPTSAPGARKPAAALAGPPPSAMKVSTGGKMIAPAATSAGAGPQAPPTANGVGAGPGHGGIMRPTENGAPGQFQQQQQQQQQQQPMMDGMMMMNGYGNGAYGNGTYGPGAMGGYGGVGNDYGGAAAPQPGGGSMYGGMGGYGSMGPGAGGSMYGSMGGANGMGSMYGGGMDGGAGGPMGSMFGGMGGPMGSMYGMGGPMGSMYGMGGPMGSMFGGMGGPMGSMYGMGGPMGSMYGMGGPMGSMYGMGGPMGSMYGGMGSMMGRSASFSSYGGNSIYGSMGGGSLLNIGSTRSIGGMWGTDSGYQVRRRRDNDIPTMAKMLQDDDDETRKRRIVTATAKQVEKDSVAKRSGAAAAPATDAAAAQEDKAKDTAEVSKPKADSDAKTKEEKAKTETKSRAAPGADAGAVLAREASTATVNKDKGAVADRNGIHGIIILEDPKSTAVAVEAVETWQKVSLKTAAGKPAECKVDEVVRGADADMSKSAVLHVLTTHLRSGHNVALIAVDKKAKMSAAVEQTIVAFYADSLGKLAADQEWKATFSASALSGTNKYRDLQDDAAGAAAAAAAAAPKDIAFGSNPIFGSCIMDLKTATMSDSAAVAKHVKSVLAKATQPQEIVFLQAIVRIRKAKDLFVCSMNAYVVRDSETAEAMAILDDRRVPVAVLRTAIGGATRTAAVTAVSGATASATEEAEAMRILGSLCAKENLPPRSGNVPRFIEYTTEQVVKIEKDMANLSGTEKDRRAHMVEKMRAMANDASELVTNVEAEPRAYPIHSKSSPAPGEKKDATAAAAASVDPKAGSKPADTAVGGKAATTAVTATAAATAPAPSPSAKAPAPTKEAPPAPATEAAATVATATATTTTAAAAPAGETAADAAAPPQPFSSIHRLAYLQDIKTPSSNKVVQVVVGGETKAYDVDECIDSPVGAKEHSVEESKELSRMTAVLGAGFNVALLGAELAAPAQPEAQMTWRYVKHLLSAVLRTATPESAAEATLHMSVVHEREVLADLISGDAAPHRLVVATSPLFGPVVHGSASAKATTPEEVEKVMSGALAKAKPFLKDGAMIVMTTVLRKVRKDDVMVASVFAVSAADMRPYKGILDHNSAYSRTLFTYALGGPSSTAVLIAASRDMDAAELANALSAQRSVSHIKVPAPRSGSVKEFVKYATGSLERQKKKVAAAAEPAEQESATNSLRRLTESLRDHEELLANPKTAEVKAYPPDSSTAAASSPAAKKQASPPAAQTAQERAAATEAAPREEPKPRAARQTPATASPLTKTEASPAAEPKPAGDAAAAAAPPPHRRRRR
ncbi:hypothetical protein NESM_000282800 [Novymonas esmeraldas]|uniref:Uncharacterized protein n=1 Tax=Novymonas esmeraldas TaxID=1808958 RepID=A0AAW0FBL0_9TRYP